MDLELPSQIHSNPSFLSSFLLSFREPSLPPCWPPEISPVSSAVVFWRKKVTFSQLIGEVNRSASSSSPQFDAFGINL